MRVSNLNERLIKTAQRSNCKYRVAAIGLDRRGVAIASATNITRFNRKGGAIHAEAAIMRKTPKTLRTILICRLGRKGELRPIHPCVACKTLADKLGIKITTIEGSNEED